MQQQRNQSAEQIGLLITTITMQNSTQQNNIIMDHQSELTHHERQLISNHQLSLNNMVTNELNNWKNELQNGNALPVTEEQINILTGKIPVPGTVPYTKQQLKKMSQQERFMIEQQQVHSRIIAANNLRITAQTNFEMRQRDLKKSKK